jgi:uncharacterized protein
MGWIGRTILTIALVILPLFLYVGFRTASSAAVLWPGTKRRGKKIVLGVVGWLFFLPLTAVLLYALKANQVLLSFAAKVSWADYAFHYPVWIGLIVVVEMIGPFVILDLAALVARLVPSKLNKNRRSLAYARLFLLAGGLLYVPVRVVMDTTNVNDDRVQIALGGLPAEFDGLTLSLIGDLQVDRYTGDARIDRVHAIIEKASPQFLLNSGDNVTSGTSFLGKAGEALCAMKGSVASIAVFGDHDFWSSPDSVRSLLSGCGWTFLDNAHRVFDYRGKTILMSGLTNVYASRLNDADLDRFLDSAPRADLRILLTHQPAERVVSRAVARGYDLILAGHTHGGQIVLHPFGIPFCPSMRETPYYTGVHRLGKTTLAVTNGVGLTLAPVRYHAPAEVTTVKLVRE